MKAGKWLPAKRAADDEKGKDNADAGEDDTDVFFVFVVVENNDGGILSSMLPEAAVVVVVIIVVRILDRQCNCPMISEEADDDEDER